MPRLYHALRALALLALSGAAPHHKPARIPTTQLAAESLGVTLRGPCLAASYRDDGSARGETFTAARGTAWAISAKPTPRYLLREGTAVACQGRGWNLGGGVLLGEHFAVDTASPYLTGGYRVDLGAWAFTADAGVIWTRYNRRPHHAPATWRVFGGGVFFVLGVRVVF